MAKWNFKHFDCAGIKVLLQVAFDKKDEQKRQLAMSENMENVENDMQQG